MALRLIATCSRGLEELLAGELTDLGVINPEIDHGAVRWEGDWRSSWRANWRLRTANRVLVELATWPARDGGALAAGAARLVADTTRSWDGVTAHQLFDPARSFSLRASAARSPMRDARWISLKVKDGIVDAQRARFGRRASVDRKAPDLPLRMRVAGDQATLLLDTSGESLDRRGYRLQMVQATLREQLAAACVLAAVTTKPKAAGAPGQSASDQQGGEPMASETGPEMLETGPVVVDPMCGSGTLLAEAGWIARGQAPGQLRWEQAQAAGTRAWAFVGLPGFDPAAFASIRAEPIQGVLGDGGVLEPGAGECQLFGSDTSAAALNATESNLRRAGLRATLSSVDAFDFEPPAASGLVLFNPPYGERLVEEPEQWKRLGDLLKQRWSGWRAVVLAGGDDRGKHIGLRPSRRISVKNGPLDVRILVLDLY